MGENPNAFTQVMLVHWESTRSLLKVVRVSSSSFFTFNNKPMFFPSPSLSAHPFGSSVPTSSFLFSSFRTLPPQSSSVLKLDGTVTSPPLPPASPPSHPPSDDPPSDDPPSDDPPSDPLHVQHKLAGTALFLKGDYESALERYLEAIEEGERLCRRENGEDIYLHPTTLLCLQFLTTLSLLPLP
jgi:hypothetical protein